MKIEKQIPKHNLIRGVERWQEVLGALEGIQAGMALPVACDNVKECQQLQYFLLQRNSKNGTAKLSLQRRGSTLYISLSEHLK